jgi:hypothetical protein
LGPIPGPRSGLMSRNCRAVGISRRSQEPGAHTLLRASKGGAECGSESRTR